MSINKCIYLDNNAATSIPHCVAKTMLMWINKGNPSSDNYIAKECKDLMDEFKRYIYKMLHASKKDYDIIFNSGSSESNSYVLHSICRSKKDHIIVSAIEHESIINAVNELVDAGRATVTWIKPNRNGFIDAPEIKKAIKKTTKLVMVMHANNETGAINDIPAIYEVCQKAEVPLYSDTAQTFGKLPIRLDKYPLDGLCASFAKTHGLAGSGLLIIKRTFIRENNMRSIIGGRQNDSLRGGTYNIVGMASGFEGLQYIMMDRQAKNDRAETLKITLVETLSRVYPTCHWRDYKKFKGKTEPHFVIIGNYSEYLPTTLLFSFVKDKVCNSKLRKELEKHHVIVSVGSACGADSTKASHVVDAMGLPKEIKRGTLRISMGDSTTLNDIKIFLQVYLNTIEKLF